MASAQTQGFIRNINDAPLAPVPMDGVKDVSMAVMVGRADGAPNFALRRFKVEPQGHTPKHAHDYEHEVIITAGTGTVLLGGEEQPIRQGDVLYVPADEEHQFKATVEQPLEFLCLVPMSRNCGEDTPGS